MVNGESHSLLEEPTGSMLAAKNACLLRLHLLYSPKFAGFHQCFRHLGKDVRSRVAIADTETTLQVRHVCQGDTSVHILRRLHELVPETRHAFESFSTGSSSRVCSTTSPTTQVRRRKESVWAARKRIFSCSPIQTWLQVFLGSRIGTDLGKQRVKTF